MKSMIITVNDRLNSINSDGSISFIHGRTGKLVKSFGCNNSAGYRTVTIGGKTVSIHRLVAEAFLPDFDDSIQVDHINGDKVDNRIENLRMLTQRQQLQAFQTKRVGASSQYRGVSLDRHKWIARIRINGKLKYLGNFHSEMAAAKAYNNAAIEAGFFKEAINQI